MNRKFLSLALLLATLLALPPVQFADEGMWLPQDISHLPIKEMRSKGLQLNPDDIYRADGASMKDAILKILTGGSLGTGSFVSGQGLIVTNHHVAFDGIAAVSTPQANHLETGFVAKSEAEELPLKNYSVSITRELKDVTKDVLAAVKPEMNSDERQKAIDQRRRELADAAKKENGALDFEVSELVTGLKYSLLGYEVFRDIRLVYAPPKAIGFFGGDDDNFQWPRHTGDFTFLRAYVSPEGKPAAYSDKNVPYHPQKFLPVSLDGFKEGDFTMIMGYPGRTYRLRDSHSVEFQQNLFLPYYIDLLSARINMLDEIGKRDPDLQLKVAAERFSLSNAVKNFTGAEAGLRRAHLIEQKRAEEAAFERFINQNPELKAKYGEVLPKIDELYRNYTRTFVRNGLLSGLVGGVSAVQLKALAVARAIDHEKPEAERSPIFADERIERIKMAIPNLLKEENTIVNQKLTELYINKALELPADQQFSFLTQRFANKNGAERQAAIADFAHKLVEGSTVENLSKLFSMSQAQLQGLNDPGINFLIDANDTFDQARKSDQAFTTAMTKYRSLYIEGITGFKKSLFYPDANATLRFSYGEVKGYRPRDGVQYTYLTTLAGVVDKDTGKEPFNVPNQLKDLFAHHNFGPYIDHNANDLPVAFLTNNDITGGSSGSPVLNGRGELIGLAFDGNYEGLGSDYGYNPDQARTICVDIRYVLFLADKMAGANRLFKELEIHGKGAAASAAAAK